MEIKNKNVIITGAARGIGKFLASEFIRNGANVAISDRLRAETKKTAKSLNVFGVSCDVTKESQIINLVNEVQSKLGSVDFFVSNAGVNIGEKGHSASASNNTWNLCWKTHVMAHVYAARAILPSMIKRKEGYFIQIISAAALLSQIGDAAYSSTKHAALGLAESMAITHRNDGIRVSAVCPQFVATEMLGYDDSTDENLPTGVKSPSSIAKAILLGIKNEKFLILPHPEVSKFMKYKNESYEKWIIKMSELRETVKNRDGTIDIKKAHRLI